MAILSRLKISPQQRYDLEDLIAEQAAARSDAKLWTQKSMSESNLVMSGFTVSGVGLTSATVAMTGCSLIVPQNTSDFSYFVSAPSEPDVIIPDADLVDGTRNYLEVSLATQDATPLTKAFWDPEANSGNGSEFNQIVNTVTDLKVVFHVSTGGFSGLPNRLPIAIIDVNGAGVIKVILDRREMYGRLAKPNDLDNEYVWGLKQDPFSVMTLTGVTGVFVAGEQITLGGETATLYQGGTTSIVFVEATGVNFASGGSVVGLTSGATGTINTIAESFVGVDKSLKGQKMINDALMTEFKNIKKTRFWWQDGPSLGGLKSDIQSLVAPISSGAKVIWDGSKVRITDDSLTPSGSDVVAAIRVLNSTANLFLTRQDDGKEVVTVNLSDIPTAGTLTLDQAGNLIAIPRTFSTAQIQTAWNSSGAYAATISGSPADGKIVITANAPGVQTDVIQNANTYTKSGSPVTASIAVKQGTATDDSIALSDGQVLYVDLPEPLVNATYDGVGVSALNYKVVARGNLALLDSSYWIAYREGSKLILRDAGELGVGESSEISDNIPQSLLDAIGLLTETSSPSYSSNIRGQANESLVKRIGTNTDAIGDSQEDRSGYLRSSDTVTWSGSDLSFTADLVLEFINTKSGTLTQHIIPAAASPISLIDGESAWISIDRGLASENPVTVNKTSVTPIPAQVQSTKDVFVLFRRVDALGLGYAHIPFHKQVLEPGQTVRLGASGSGSGSGGDSFIGDLKRRLALSIYDYVTPNIFETDEDDKVDGTSTGAYDTTSKTFKFTSIGQTLVSTQHADPEFTAQDEDVLATDLYVNWDPTAVDPSATYEVSRNGGNAWQPVTMSRIGVSPVFVGNLTFVNEATNPIQKQWPLSGPSTLPLNTTTNQAAAQIFTLASATRITHLTAYLDKLGAPAGTIYFSIVKDSAGLPSLATGDIVYRASVLSSSIASGISSIAIPMPIGTLAAGTYWITFSSDAAYKAAYTGSDYVSPRTRAGVSPDGGAASFNGTVYTSIAPASFSYQLLGYVTDLRVRITSSATDRLLAGYGMYYGISQAAPRNPSIEAVLQENGLGSTNPVNDRSSPGLGPIVRSPDGSLWRISVTNLGAVLTTKL